MEWIIGPGVKACTIQGNRWLRPSKTISQLALLHSDTVGHENKMARVIQRCYQQMLSFSLHLPKGLCFKLRNKTETFGSNLKKMQLTPWQVLSPADITATTLMKADFPIRTAIISTDTCLVYIKELSWDFQNSQHENRWLLENSLLNPTSA